MSALLLPRATRLALAAGALLCACGGDLGAGSGSTTAPGSESERDFGRIADFRLVERSGREVTRADLEGRTWIVDFFFTTCTGPCPAMTTNMKRLQDELEGTGVGLLSITVDPETDDVATLREYAARWGADPERWWFLTGEESEIYALMREGFLLGVERADPEDAAFGMQVTHATRLVVLDRDGLLRGFYEGTSEAGRLQALARARALAGRSP